MYRERERGLDESFSITFILFYLVGRLQLLLRKIKEKIHPGEELALESKESLPSKSNNL